MLTRSREYFRHRARLGRVVQFSQSHAPQPGRFVDTNKVTMPTSENGCNNQTSASEHVSRAAAFGAASRCGVAYVWKGHRGILRLSARERFSVEFSRCLCFGVPDLLVVMSPSVSLSVSVSLRDRLLNTKWQVKGAELKLVF